jgi:glucose-1-phosphate thymidylyltransferase
MTEHNQETPRRRLIGVIPAAGQGSRLAPFTYPKELLPIVYRKVGSDSNVLTPRPVLQFSLEEMKSAGISECVMIIAHWKLEIARVFSDGSASGVSLSYVMRNTPRGLADAVDAAYPWVRDYDVALTLPDTLVFPRDALRQMWGEHLRLQSDLLLGVFPTNKPQELGPVRVDADGKVVEVLDKPKTTDLRNTWGLAIWSPRFSALLHERVTTAPEGDQPNLGLTFHQAVQAGLNVRALCFDAGEYLDIGTPEGLGRVVSDVGL